MQTNWIQFDWREWEAPPKLHENGRRTAMPNSSVNGGLKHCRTESVRSWGIPCPARDTQFCKQLFFSKSFGKQYCTNWRTHKEWLIWDDFWALFQGNAWSVGPDENKKAAFRSELISLKHFKTFFFLKSGFVSSTSVWNTFRSFNFEDRTAAGAEGAQRRFRLAARIWQSGGRMWDDRNGLTNKAPSAG